LHKFSKVSAIENPRFSMKIWINLHFQRIAPEIHLPVFAITWSRPLRTSAGLAKLLQRCVKEAMKTFAANFAVAEPWDGNTREQGRHPA
jgi:hypothetical protein